MSPVVYLSFWAFAGAFLGSAAGMVFFLRQAIRHFRRALEEDPEIQKVQISVTMVEAEED